MTDSLNGRVGARLTLTQGVAVADADVTGAASIFLEPFEGNQVSIYDGANWNTIIVAPSTYSLSASGLAANTNYDVYLTNNGGLPQLAWSPAWSNDTTPPARLLQDGVWVGGASPGYRLMGTVRISAIAGQLVDSHTFRRLSNLYNPQPRSMWVIDNTTTWTYSIATAYQQAHANPANQLDYVSVVPRPVWAQVQAAVISSSGAGAMVGIGVDGALGNSAQFCQQASIPASLASNSFQTSCVYTGTPGLGSHTLLWLEHGFANGTTQTWLGYIPPWQQSGIFGEVAN